MSKLKQVIVVRTDLNLGKGKIAAQVAHASLCAYLKAKFFLKRKWLKEGSLKIVVKVKNKQELIEIYQKCIDVKLPCCLIKDAAKTQLKEPDYTALGIGPDKASKIDKITGHLKLL